MKKTILMAGIIMMTFGCQQQVDLSKQIRGTYSMVSQEIQQGDKTTTYKDLKQLKMYTSTHYMYTQINPSDSSSAFGVGTYSTNKDTLTEHLLFSAADTKFDDKPANYRLAIKMTPEGYQQVINDFVIDGQKSRLTEYYSRVKDTSTSPIDGVWKEQVSYLVKGADTVWNKRTQFKAYFDGYFMFGSSTPDSLGNRTTDMGYGTFTRINDHQIQETDLNSSYPFVAGNTFVIDLVMSGNDRYQQTISNADSSRSIEIYERVK